MIQRRAVKSILARQPYRLLSLISKASFAQALLAICGVLLLSLKSVCILLVSLQDFPAHLTIKSASSELTGIDVMRVHAERRFTEEVVLVIDELSISGFNLAKLLVASWLSSWSDGCMGVPIVSIIIEKSLTDIFERPGFVGTLGLLGEHAGVMVFDLVNCLLGERLFY